MAWSLYHQGQVEQAVTYLRQHNRLVQPSASAWRRPMRITHQDDLPLNGYNI